MTTGLADRMSAAPMSVIAQISERAAFLASQGRDVIDLSIGEPDFPMRDVAIDAAHAAARAGLTGYAARASDAFAAGRLDARFFAPRIQALLDIHGRDGRSLGDLATSRRQKFRPQDCATFNYIEIGDIDDAGAATSTPLACADAPSRATWHVRPNDIVTSTVRPIRRLLAQIAPEQDGYVASSGFLVINPQQIAPELLLTFLRLPVICELLDLYASASM